MTTPARELGEFGLIERLSAMLDTHPDVAVGVGDDGAVVTVEPGCDIVVSSDSLVADVHFRLRPERAYDTGRKAVAVNVSDMAAMGARPKFIVVNLAVTPDVSWEFVRDLYRGMVDEARLWGAAVVGGDTVSTPADFGVHVAVLGTVPAGRAVRRRGARVGDLIAVTHHVGAAAAGLAVLEQPELPIPERYRAEVIAKHLRPVPRVEAGAELAEGIATAMLDVSDGIAGDLRHLCRASGVGAVLFAHRIPISDGTRAVAAALGKDPLELALSGGEDYELLFTTSCKDLAVTGQLPRSKTPVTVIGEVLPAADGLWLELAGGRRVPLNTDGFVHF